MSKKEKCPHCDQSFVNVDAHVRRMHSEVGLTGKQKKLIDIMTRNIGNENPQSMYDMMLEAGYAPNTAKQQSGILGGLEGRIDPIVEKMVKLREKAMDRAAQTVSKAKYKDAVKSVDYLTKNIQLLSGKETERHKHEQVVYLPQRDE